MRKFWLALLVITVFLIARFLQVSAQGCDGHTVKENDTLGGIAQAYGLTIQKLQQYNPGIKNLDLLSVGQCIRLTPLPEVTSTPWPTRTPEPSPTPKFVCFTTEYREVKTSTCGVIDWLKNGCKKTQPVCTAVGFEGLTGPTPIPEATPVPTCGLFDWLAGRCD